MRSLERSADRRLAPVLVILLAIFASAQTMGCFGSSGGSGGKAPVLGQAGDSCDDDSDCESELICYTVRDQRTCRADWGLEGDPCDAGDCQHDFSCVFKNDDTCMLTRFEGEQCHWNDQCEVGLVCNWGYTPDQCAPPGQIDDPCGYEGECATGLTCDLDLKRCIQHCSSDSQCGAGYVCVKKSDNRCLPEVAAGQSCYWNDECADGLVCHWAYAPYVCRPPSSGGEPCTMQNECAYGLECNLDLGLCIDHCTVDSDCPPGQVCVAKADNSCMVERGLNELCNFNEECAGDLICNWSQTPYICLPPSQEGEPCAMDNECAAGLECDLDVGLCIVRCHAQSDCPAGSWCDQSAGLPQGGSCAPQVAPGEECSSPDSCTDGYYCDELAEVPTCQPPAAEGEPCGNPLACDEGLVCLWYEPLPVCAPPPEEGGTCTTLVPCVEGLVCSIGLPEQLGECLVAPLDVTLCAWGAGDCAEEEVCNLLLAPPQCSPAPTMGEPCSGYVPCAEGLVCSSVDVVPGVCEEPVPD